MCDECESPAFGTFADSERENAQRPDSEDPETILSQYDDSIYDAWWDQLIQPVAWEDERHGGPPDDVDGEFECDPEPDGVDGDVECDPEPDDVEAAEPETPPESEPNDQQEGEAVQGQEPGRRESPSQAEEQECSPEQEPMSISSEHRTEFDEFDFRQETHDFSGFVSDCIDTVTSLTMLDNINILRRSTGVAGAARQVLIAELHTDIRQRPPGGLITRGRTGLRLPFGQQMRRFVHQGARGTSRRVPYVNAALALYRAVDLMWDDALEQDAGRMSRWRYAGRSGVRIVAASLSVAIPFVPERVAEWWLEDDEEEQVMH